MWANDGEVTDVFFGDGCEEGGDLTGKRKADGDTSSISHNVPHKEVFNESEGMTFDGVKSRSRLSGRHLCDN